MSASNAWMGCKASDKNKSVQILNPLLRTERCRPKTFVDSSAQHRENEAEPVHINSNEKINFSKARFKPGPNMLHVHLE